MQILRVSVDILSFNDIVWQTCSVCHAIFKMNDGDLINSARVSLNAHLGTFTEIAVH